MGGNFEFNLGIGRGAVAGLGAPDFHGFKFGVVSDGFMVSKRRLKPPARGPIGIVAQIDAHAQS